MFILGVENGKHIKGINSGEVKHKIAQFADNTQLIIELFLHGSPNSLKYVMKILTISGDISGL